MNDTDTHPRNDRALFLWLILASLVGALSGVPWAVVVSRDPDFAWLEAGLSFLQLLPACVVGVWLGPKIGLGSGLRELASRTPRAWEIVRKGIIPGTLVGNRSSRVVGRHLTAGKRQDSRMGESHHS